MGQFISSIMPGSLGVDEVPYARVAVNTAVLLGIYFSRNVTSCHSISASWTSRPSKAKKPRFLGRS